MLEKNINISSNKNFEFVVLFESSFFFNNFFRLFLELFSKFIVILNVFFENSTRTAIIKKIDIIIIEKNNINVMFRVFMGFYFFFLFCFFIIILLLLLLLQANSDIKDFEHLA